MSTTHPNPSTTHPIITTPILEDVITFCKIYAEEAANSFEVYPQILPLAKWREEWEIAWNSAYNYATEGVPLTDLYGTSTFMKGIIQ